MLRQTSIVARNLNRGNDKTSTASSSTKLRVISGYRFYICKEKRSSLNTQTCNYDVTVQFTHKCAGSFDLHEVEGQNAHVLHH